MTDNEDHIVMAAEYVLGTLDGDERVQVETMMNVDQDFKALVESWERRLGELHAMVAAIEPPEEVRPKVAGSAPSRPLVAVLSRDGGPPAFVMTVDVASKTFTVRRAGADPEGAKSYELWMVSDKFTQPRSLGVIDKSDFTTKAQLASYDRDTVDSATYAITLEPQGGSPTGQPTSAPIFAGKLIEIVPQAQPGAR